MKKYFLFLILIALFVNIKGISFDEYLDIVMEKSDIKRDVKLYRKSDYWNKLNDLSQILPQINVTAQLPVYNYSKNKNSLYEEVNEDKELSYNTSVQMIQLLPSNTEIYSNYQYSHVIDSYDSEMEEEFSQDSFSIGLRQYLWGTNEGYHSYKMWRNQRKLNKINNKNYILDILYQAYERYIDFLIAKRSMELNKKMFERYENIYESAVSKYKMGLYDQITYNRIKKEYRFYELDYYQSKNDFEREKESIEIFLNQKIKDLDSDLTNVNYEILKNKKPRDRKELRKIELDNLYRNYKLSKSNNEIKVYAGVEKVYNESNFENSSEEVNNYQLSLGISIPFSNFSNYSSYKLSKTSYLIDKNTYEDRIEEINLNYNRLCDSLKNYYRKIELYKEIIPDLKQNYNASLKRFKMGLITLEELRSIENEYINSEMEYLQILKNYNLTAVEISKYIGNANKIMEGLL